MTDVFLCLSQSPGQDYFILDIFSSSDQFFLKKHLTNAPGYSIITKRFEEVATIQSFGRLAQLVEHLLDVQVVSGSIPLTSTKSVNKKDAPPVKPRFSGLFVVLGGKKRQGFSVDAFGSFCPSLRNRTPEASFFEPRFPLFQENSIHSQSSVQVENLCAFL